MTAKNSSRYEWYELIAQVNYILKKYTENVQNKKFYWNKAKPGHKIWIALYKTAIITHDDEYCTITWNII